jgi:hypothetical protein
MSDTPAPDVVNLSDSNIDPTDVLKALHARKKKHCLETYAENVILRAELLLYNRLLEDDETFNSAHLKVQASIADITLQTRNTPTTTPPEPSKE